MGHIASSSVTTARSFKIVTPSLEVLLESGLGEGLQLVVEVLGPCLEKNSALVNFEVARQKRVEKIFSFRLEKELNWACTI